MKRRANIIFVNSLSYYARMGIGMLLRLLITRTALEVLTESSTAAKEIFGIFMLLISISTAIGFLNESTLQAMVRFLAISLHNGDHHKTKQLFSSGWVMSSVIGSTIAILIAVLVPWIIKFFNIPEWLMIQAKYVIWLSALAQIIVSMSQPWYAILNAQDRYTLVNLLYVLENVSILIGLMLLRFLPIDLLLGLSLVWLSPRIIIRVLLVSWVTLKKPSLRISWANIRLQECKKLFSLGGWSSLIGLASNLYERTDQILINLLLGPAFNAIYAIVIEIGTALSSLVTSLTKVLLPTASRIVDSGSVWEKQQLMLRSTRYALTIALPAIVGLGIFRREIIELWLGKGFDEAIAILPLTMLLVFLRIPILVTWPYLTATNQLKLPALAIFVDGILNVIISIFYVNILNLGLAGIVLGTVSSNLFRFTLFQIPFVARLIKLPIYEYWLKCYGKPIILMMWFFPALWKIQQWQFPTFTKISLLIVCITLYKVSIWFWIFDEYERNFFSNIFNKILPKDKKY